VKRLLVLLAAGCAARGIGHGAHGAPSLEPRPRGRFPDVPPVPGPTVPLRLPPVSRHRLANGLEVWVAAEDAWPRAAVALAVRAGAEADPPGKAGLAALTADLLLESERVAALADEGAELGAETSVSGTTLHLWSLTEGTSLRTSIGLLAGIVTTPVFRERDLVRLRADRAGKLRARHNDPGVIANETLALAVYGGRHAYGWPVGGRERTLATVRVADVEAFWRDRFRPDRSAAIVVGAVRDDDIVAILEHTFGRWKAAARADTVPAAIERPGPRLVIVDRPGATESEVRLGQKGLGRGDADRFAADVLAGLLGGGFRSRLNRRLRDELGYTGSAWAAFDSSRSPGPFIMGASVRTDATAAAIRAFIAEVRRIQEAEPSGEELARARDGVLLGLPARFEGAAALAGELAELYVNDLPPDYYDGYVEKVRAVTAADVQRAAAEHLRPGGLRAVVVGDRRTIEGGLATLGMEDAQIWDEDGSPVR
jgi:zinc protease